MNEDIIKNIRDFVDKASRSGKLLTNYRFKSDPVKYFNDSGISVGLEQNKELILKEETRLELGGMNKRSFSLIHPINETHLIEDGTIKLLGPEAHQISELNINFGLFILIAVNDISKKEYNDLKSLNFLSNGIEGFSIRTIPRRFWCRINSDVFNKNFSFEFLANAIIYLYKKKFKNLIKKIEILIICSYLDSIEKFIEITSEITDKYQEELKAKIDNWIKRIDCEYEWGCEICPYREECYYIKQALVEREKIGR
jgi:CO dehydrogenase/acetyl-CoA synthase beta subunit